MNSDNLCQAVITLGGKGSRFKNISGEIPKPLFPILDKSTLYRCCEELVKNKIKNIIFNLGFKNDIFLNYAEELKETLSFNLKVYVENQPLGECGALWEIEDLLFENFVFINGDLIFSLEFSKLFFFHKRLNSMLTLVTHTSDHPEDSDLVSCPNGCLIEDIFFKTDKNKLKNAYLGNSGISVINKKILRIIQKPTNSSSNSIFSFLVKKMYEKSMNIYSYNTTEYIKDMGTAKRFTKVENDLKQNIIVSKNYKNKQKALFLDRDNTILSCEIGKYIVKDSRLEFLDENIEKLAILSKDFDIVCLITNQPQIAMGALTLKELDYINCVLINYCLKKGLKIDVVTFCPHHPHRGFDKEISILKKDCFCRKPNPGLFFEQAFLRNINLENSLMVGDSITDLVASKNAGCQFKYVGNL
tara:strand:+ start:621 stop:1865 length:1245 start_codon:yes stop_codon:yes gene_type:complete